MHTFSPHSEVELSYTGPDLSVGPLPTLFYFALSKEESLSLDPFNQPVTALAGNRLRIFSATIPGHGPDLPATEALLYWAKALAQSQDPLTPFFDQVALAIQTLLKQGLIPKNQLAFAGLSRGAFVAAHIAARVPECHHLLGFAPLTSLARAREFAQLQDNPLVRSFDLLKQVPLLFDRTLRFYIGNLDTRVGTKECFTLIESLAKEAFSRKIRSPQIELLITPSIGHMGHGTTPEIFRSGALWIAEQLEGS